MKACKECGKMGGKLEIYELLLNGKTVRWTDSRPEADEWTGLTETGYYRKEDPENRKTVRVSDLYKEITPGWRLQYASMLHQAIGGNETELLEKVKELHNIIASLTYIEGAEKTLNMIHHMMAAIS